jgi:two-component system, chemotaxis family, chemotaxis protein CheY
MTKLNPEKILVTDDSAFMRQYEIGFLNEAGYKNIVEASNGAEAMKIYNREKPDVIFLDLIMPVQDGITTLEQLVAKDAKVIVITAIGQTSYMEKVIKMGAKGYFVKPFFDAKEIDEKIKLVMSGGSFVPDEIKQ